MRSSEESIPQHSVMGVYPRYMMVKRPDTSCITAGQSDGGCDPFSDFFGRGLAEQESPSGECDNLAVILSPGDNITIIEPICRLLRE